MEHCSLYSSELYRYCAVVGEEAEAEVEELELELGMELGMDTNPVFSQKGYLELLLCNERELTGGYIGQAF